MPIMRKSGTRAECAPTVELVESPKRADGIPGIPAAADMRPCSSKWAHAIRTCCQQQQAPHTGSWPQAITLLRA